MAMSEFSVRGVTGNEVSFVGALAGRAVTRVEFAADGEEGHTLLPLEAIVGAAHSYPANVVLLHGHDPLSVPGVDKLVRALAPDHEVVIYSCGSSDTPIPERAHVVAVLDGREVGDAFLSLVGEVIFLASDMNPIERVWQWCHRVSCVPFYIHPSMGSIARVYNFVAHSPSFCMSPEVVSHE
jgi:hypothetical protein